MKIQIQNQIKRKGAVPGGRAPDVAVYQAPMGLLLKAIVHFRAEKVSFRTVAPRRRDSDDLVPTAVDERLQLTLNLFLFLVVTPLGGDELDANAITKHLIFCAVGGLGLRKVDSRGLRRRVFTADQKPHQSHDRDEANHLSHYSVLLSRYNLIPSKHYARIPYYPSILDHKSQEVARAASWECLKNFLFCFYKIWFEQMFLQVLWRFFGSWRSIDFSYVVRLFDEIRTYFERN